MTPDELLALADKLKSLADYIRPHTSNEVWIANKDVHLIDSAETVVRLAASRPGRQQPSQSKIRNLLEVHGYNPNEVHPECYRNFSWIGFTNAILALSLPVQDRDAIIEECAVAAEAQDRIGREWVPNSLWANILSRAGSNVRTLKSAPRYDAPHNSGESDPAMTPDYRGADA